MSDPSSCIGDLTATLADLLARLSTIRQRCILYRS